MSNKVVQIIEEQINAWKHSNTLASSRLRGKKTYPVITISREFGAQGADLAAHLGQMIGFKVWDKDLLQAIAKEIGGGIRTIEVLDERRQQTVEDTVSGFLMNIPTNMNYLRSLIRVIKTIEEYGNSIIVGRAANYICKNPKSLHIRVVCPLNKRIAIYAKKMNLSLAETKEIIERKDREREDFVNQNFHKDMKVPTDYDLIINSDRFTIEQMASIILQAYEKKTGMKIKVHG
ncbi:MAG: cytidylate kinase-like family protein [Balneolaceae bacterium]|nr:MAG: cytidylate kinase-like family protein [Balneolaceae bacterium]